MYRIRLPILIAALFAARAFAEDASWTLAAEKFASVRVPSVYAGVESSLPALVLARLETVNERMIFPDERKSRALSALSAERIKLVSERSALVLERDKALLSDKGTLKKKKMRADAEKKIAAKERELRALDGRIRDSLVAPDEDSSTRRVALWESGKRLFERKAGESLAKSLSDANISAVLTGTVEDLSGYLLVTARVDTGIAGLPAITVSEAAPYDEIDSLVTALATRLLPELARTAPVTVRLAVNPEDAVVFVDERQVYDASIPISLYSGEHTLSVSRDGYRSAARTYDFSGAESYDVDIALVREPTVSVAFETTGEGAALFFRTQAAGTTPLVTDLPAMPAIGEAESGGIKTFFVFDPGPDAADSSLSSLIRENKTSTKLRIEGARRWFYWSLGALYVSLPVYMISHDMARDSFAAFQDGKLEQTQKNADDVNSLIRFSTNAGYVSLALGANVAYQLFRYILASEQAIPKRTVNEQTYGGER